MTDIAVADWDCPCGYFRVGNVRVSGCDAEALPECPFCGRKVELMAVRTDGGQP